MNADAASQAQENYPKDYVGQVRLAADAPLGTRPWRLWTSQGATPALRFVVGELPEIVEQENDGEPLPVRVALPLTINGRTFPREDVDEWEFEARAGQVVWAEVCAARIGSPVDSQLEVLDSAGRVPPTGDVFDGQAPTLVATTDRASARTRQGWREAGAEVLVIETDAGRVSLPALFADLGKREVQAVLIEGGPTLAWSAIDDDLVDRLVLYLAPRLIGGADAPTVLEGRGFAPVAAALPLVVHSVERVGQDIRVEADVHRDR